MFLQSKKPQLSRPFVDEIINSFNTIPGAELIGIGLCKLFTAGPSPITPENIAADFTVATFSGYANFVATFGSTQVNLQSGEGRGLLCNATFNRAIGIISETVAGYFVLDAAGGIVMSEYFAAPVPMTTPGDFLDLGLIIGANWLFDVN